MIVCRNRILRLHHFTSKELVERRAGDDLQARFLPKQVRVESFIADETLPPDGYIVFVVVDDKSRHYRKGERFRLPVRQAMDMYGKKAAPAPV